MSTRDRAVDPSAGPAEGAADEQQALLANSAVMAAGTVVSRMSGFVRSALLAAALGASLHADIFTISNTVPNMLYILLAGGVFNAVLVPQLVRAMTDDADQGEAYTNRIITLAALFLGVVTVALVALAPQLMSLYLGDRYDEPDRTAHLQSVIDFARYCLPQVFFYGMFVLVGQILNARHRFGPMMWAPIANNVISVAVLVVYLFAFGPARGAESTAAFSSGQELLLGLGSTAGIAAQLLILLPYLRRAGFRYRPRFDFRGTGLSHTLRLGLWTVLFVVVNQVAYTVVVRLASGGTADGGDGTGYTIYSSTFLIVMVPHSVITVSLATAVLPRLSRYAAAGDVGQLGATLSANLRTALAVVVPFAAVLPLVARDLAQVIWGHGAAAEQFTRYAPSLALFGPGLVMFTVHYLVLRGFYALELTRTVFYVQCVVATVNVVAALLLVRGTDAAGTSPALVLAYATSYAVGAVLSYTVLRRRVGRLETGRLARFVLRLAVAVAVSTAVAGVLAVLLGQLADDPGWVVAGLRGAVVAAAGGVTYLVTARVFRLQEVTTVIRTVTRRGSRTPQA
ncbi:murein biosynthesis integral membrane protein MurJ [Nocardioides rubriscoriae]|uniref:murein biosynthesis integral membrane protein MurJ n=1 Tax=Nocardioides rubriscoriae TaxID=642762 RepID=UPI001FE74D6E|nr:murein biosynthesis integral membrane protein MurJ [Nocardioides rubriscoriae]